MKRELKKMDDEIIFNDKTPEPIIDEYFNYSKIYCEMQRKVFSELDRKAINIITASGIIISILGFGLREIISYLFFPQLIFVLHIFFIFSILFSLFVLFVRKVDEITKISDLIKGTKDINNVFDIKRKLIKRFSSTSLSYDDRNKVKSCLLKVASILLLFGFIFLLVILLMVSAKLINENDNERLKSNSSSTSNLTKTDLTIERNILMMESCDKTKKINFMNREPGDLPPSEIYMKARLKFDGGVTWENKSKAIK